MGVNLFFLETVTVLVVCQFGAGVKLLVAAVTSVLIVSWEVLVLNVAKGASSTGRDLSTEFALKLSLSCIPRYMHHILVQVIRYHLSSKAFLSTCTSWASQFCVLQYSQNIK